MFCIARMNFPLGGENRVLDRITEKNHVLDRVTVKNQLFDRLTENSCQRSKT